MVSTRERHSLTTPAKRRWGYLAQAAEGVDFAGAGAGFDAASHNKASARKRYVLVNMIGFFLFIPKSNWNLSRRFVAAFGQCTVVIHIYSLCYAYSPCDETIFTAGAVENVLQAEVEGGVGVLRAKGMTTRETERGIVTLLRWCFVERAPSVPKVHVRGRGRSAATSTVWTCSPSTVFGAAAMAKDRRLDVV